MTRALLCEAFSGQYSRLLIDLNRSLHHPNVFSSYSKTLSIAEKHNVIQHYYHAYREQVTQAISNALNTSAFVLHISIHSFTPNLDGQDRLNDIGLLYDPKRKYENIICQHWKNLLKQHSTLSVRMNYPYKGISDGFVTALRKQFTDKEYIGVELETNQRCYNNREDTNYLARHIIQSLALLSTIKIL